MAGKSRQYREKLDDLWGTLVGQFDLSGSRVNPGVKNGRSRSAYIDQYLSYKNADALNLGLAVYQQSPASTVRCEVSLRDTKRGRSRTIWRKEWGYAEFAGAAAYFSDQLAQLGVPKQLR